MLRLLLLVLWLWLVLLVMWVQLVLMLEVKVSVSEVCRGRERLRGVVGSEGNAAAVLGEGIHVWFDGEGDGRRQRGAFDAEKASAGRLSTSTPSIGTPQAALVSSDPQ